MDPPAAGSSSVASRFVSEASLEEAKATRAQQWKEAYERLGQEAPPPEEDTQPYDGRSLWEKLQENKDKKQEAFDEKLKFKNQFRALDEDEIDFLESITDDTHEEELEKQKAIKDALLGFRQAVISRQALAPPSTLAGSPLLSSTTSAAPISPTLASSSSATAAATTAKKPPAKKQKKTLPGVIVKKKEKSTPTAAAVGVKRSASGDVKGSETNAKVGSTESKDEGSEVKKQKVNEKEEKEKKSP